MAVTVVKTWVNTGSQVSSFSVHTVLEFVLKLQPFVFAPTQKKKKRKRKSLQSIRPERRFSHSSPRQQDAAETAAGSGTKSRNCKQTP